MRTLNRARKADRWGATGAPLEYWFFRTQWADGALLVDIIRRRGEPEVRVSVISQGVATVHRAFETSHSATGGPSAASCRIELGATAGRVGPVQWDLRFHATENRIVMPPAPLRWARATDLSLASWPLGTATGTVQNGDIRTVLDGQPSMMCHYWGRRLPDAWAWVSAHDSRSPGVALEIGMIKSRLWDLQLPVPTIGYAWLASGGKCRRVASPLTGLVQFHGHGFDAPFDIIVRSPQGAFRVRARSEPGSDIDLGDRIRHTLRAHCEVRESGVLVLESDSAVLEFRDPRDHRR